MSGEPTDPVLQAINALEGSINAKIEQLRLDLLDRLDQLEEHDETEPLATDAAGGELSR
jgi:hypothetical protein